MALPLNLVWVAMRVISCDKLLVFRVEVSAVAGAFVFEPSSGLQNLPVLAACVAARRSRWKQCAKSVSLRRAKIPFALRIATVEPRICEFIRSAMARLAASSFDELTRRPDERRCTRGCERHLRVGEVSLRCSSEERLVLIYSGHYGQSGWNRWLQAWRGLVRPIKSEPGPLIFGRLAGAHGFWKKKKGTTKPVNLKGSAHPERKRPLKGGLKEWKPVWGPAKV
jgi:hypothetical protein